MIPTLLVAVALVDGGFAGFRAATGRNARIDKRAYNLRAARRGLMVSSAAPFAAVVATSLAAYWVLPIRESTFVILVGLGPFTLARPFVVLAAAAAAVAGSSQWLVWAGTVTASAGVLLVEPRVHRRWYSEPV